MDCGELKEGEDDGVPVPSDGDAYEDFVGMWEHSGEGEESEENEKAKRH